MDKYGISATSAIKRNSCLNSHKTDFVEAVKHKLGILAKGRKAMETDAGYQLREPTKFYMPHLGGEKDDIGPENGYFWNIDA